MGRGRGPASGRPPHISKPFGQPCQLRGPWAASCVAPGLSAVRFRLPPLPLPTGVPLLPTGFPSGDVDALADAIHKISGSSEAEQKAMAEMGKAMVFAEHDKLKQVPAATNRSRGHNTPVCADAPSSFAVRTHARMPHRMEAHARTGYTQMQHAGRPGQRRRASQLTAPLHTFTVREDPLHHPGEGPRGAPGPLSPSRWIAGIQKGQH